MSTKSASAQSHLLKRTLFDGMTIAYLVGTAYLMLGLPIDTQALPLRSVTWISILFIILGGICSLGLNRWGLKTLGESIFEPPHKKSEAQKKWFFTFWGIELIVLFAVTFYLGILQTQTSLWELLDQDGFAGAKRMFGALFSPELTVLPSAIIAIIETIFIAFMATILAIPPAFALSFICAKNVMQNHIYTLALYTVLRTILNITRSVEPLIWAIIFSVWVGIGPFAGMLALMIQSIASLTKQYSEIVECIEVGPVEAIEATGARPLQVIWYAMVPQIVLPYISFTIYRWDINVRMATVIGLVGGGGIGTLLIQYQGQAMWQEVSCIIMVIAAVVWLMDTASAYIREAIK